MKPQKIPTIISRLGRAPVIPQPGTGLTGANTPAAVNYPAIRSPKSNRQPPRK